MFFFLLLIIISIFLEGTVTTLPLTLVCLLCFTIYKKGAIVFPIAFVAGLFQDILRVSIIGVSSTFFIIFVFLTLLYRRKYEINSYPFVVVAAFLGSLGYLSIFGGENIFIQAILTSLIALFFFATFKFFDKDLKSQIYI